jgi:Family of unknown function (DUF6636)
VGYSRDARRLLTVAVCAVIAVIAVPAGQAGGAATLPGIRSPTGNIRCLLVREQPAFLECDIAQSDYAKKLTAHCASTPIFLDWFGFELDATGKGKIGCTGGTLYDPATQHPGYVTLAYGTSWRRGSYTCTSRFTGMTCSDPAGHGVFLSRQSWRVW